LQEWVSFLGFYIWMFVSFHRLTSQYLSNQATMSLNLATWRRLHQSPIKTSNNLVTESADNVAADASIPTTGNVQPNSRNVLSCTQVVLEFTTCY
jgi:hypothetical protein